MPLGAILKEEGRHRPAHATLGAHIQITRGEEQEVVFHQGGGEEAGVEHWDGAVRCV